MAMNVKITIENLNRTIEAEVGQDLRSALLENDVEVHQGFKRYTFPVLGNCDGHGVCGSCVVDIVKGDGLSDQTMYEKVRSQMYAGKRAANPRQACLTRVYQDCVIRTLATPADE